MLDRSWAVLIQTRTKDGSSETDPLGVAEKSCAWSCAGSGCKRPADSSQEEFSCAPLGWRLDRASALLCHGALQWNREEGKRVLLHSQRQLPFVRSFFALLVFFVSPAEPARRFVTLLNVPHVRVSNMDARIEGACGTRPSPPPSPPLRHACPPLPRSRPHSGPLRHRGGLFVRAQTNRSGLGVGFGEILFPSCARSVHQSERSCISTVLLCVCCMNWVL